MTKTFIIPQSASDYVSTTNKLISLQLKIIGWILYMYYFNNKQIIDLLRIYMHLVREVVVAELQV